MELTALPDENSGIAHLRAFIQENRLDIKTAGKGRTKQAILTDIRAQHVPGVGDMVAPPVPTPLAPAVPVAPAAPASAWTCGTCTFDNANDNSRCEMCATARDMCTQSTPIPPSGDVTFSLGNLSLSNCCYYEHCLEFVKTLPDVAPFCDLQSDHAMCYCPQCHANRGDRDTYKRGNPRKKYALPQGWVRLPLRAGSTQASSSVFCAFENWHRAFHGTCVEALQPILATGRLLRPGETTAALDGAAVAVRPGHIKKPFRRVNAYTKEEELFDPMQIFLSPSIRYCELPQYAKHSVHRGQQVQVAFQVLLKPGSYGIGQETVRATGTIDPAFSNDEIELYTDGTEAASHLLVALMVKIG